MEQTRLDRLMVSVDRLMVSLDRLKVSVDRCLAFVLFIIITFILFCVSWQVFSRYVLGSPSTFTEEIVRFLLVWFGLLGASYAFGAKSHIALTLFFDKFKGEAKKFLIVFVDATILLLSVIVLVVGGTKLMIVSRGQVSPVLLIPMQWVYMVSPISGLLIIFYEIYHIIGNFRHEGGKR